MSRWGADDLEAEDYDPNKDYSVQVKRQDGGLASTQVKLNFKSFRTHKIKASPAKNS